MPRTFAVLICSFLATSALHAQPREPLFGWGGEPEHLGGLMVVRQGGQKSVSWGGILFDRKVKVTNATPEGPVTTRFILPSALHSPTAVPVPGMSPAYLHVDMPDHFGLLYIDSEMVRSPGGLTRKLESQPLTPGKNYSLKIRGVYAVDHQLMIEDKTITLTAGQATRVTFDGQRAVAVPLPRPDSR